MRKVQFAIIDAFSISLTYVLAMLLFYALDITISMRETYSIVLIIIGIKIAFYILFGLYRIMIEHIGFEDLMKIVIAVIISNFFLMMFFLVTTIDFMNPMAFVFITPMEIGFIALPRVMKRMVAFFRSSVYFQNPKGPRTLILGAGDGGELVLKEIHKNKALQNVPVAFVDDNPEKIGSRLLGIDVVGPIDKIDDFIDHYGIEEVIIAIANLSLKRLQELVNVISEKDVRIKRLPLMSEIDTDAPRKVKDVQVEDLLERDEVTLDNDGIGDFIKGETVLVTGGGGSIGSELCRQIAKLKPKKLIIFDIYENSAYDIQMELLRTLKRKKIKLNIEVLIGSVYNEGRMREIFEIHKPTIVFHAAAYKHVPLMEDSPKEAVRTNVLGTYYTAKLAKEYHVKNFILVSSDKAVRPTSIMGASKRYAELIMDKFNEEKNGTRYASVRFGNVLGSNGSVIPLFKKQIEEGGPLTVTHPDITRYFMTIPEAVGLILQCAVYSEGGEIFILDMGEPIKIKDLAEKMIKLAGFQVGRDIDIEYTGLRRGEKLYEELLLDDAKKKIKTANDKIFIEKPMQNGDVIDVDTMKETLERCNCDEIKSHIAASIKSYTIDKKRTSAS